MTENSPLVCICVPTYNSAATVRETIESILAQTYSNLVVHVSDNASLDNTLAVIESLADERIIIHRQDKNIGAEGNFTRCIELATGKYTAIFHADDVYEPDMLMKQVAYLEKNHDVGAVFTEASTIDAQGVPLGSIGRVPGGGGGVARFNFPELLKTMLLHHNFLVCPSVLVRTDIYRAEIGVWGSNLFRSSSDVDTWLRLARIKPIAVLDQQLMRYRISSAQFSDSIRNRTERADFFLVMDHYLAKPEVRDFLTKDDFRHYGWLERHERVARTFNLFVLERFKEVNDLLRGTFCLDAIRAAMHNRRGLVTLGGVIVLRLLMSITPRRGIPLVRAIKKISWK